jgi:hypothetical protein
VNEWLKHLEDRFNALVLGKARAAWYIHRTKADSGGRQTIPVDGCLVVKTLAVTADTTVIVESGGSIVILG